MPKTQEGWIRGRLCEGWRKKEPQYVDKIRYGCALCNQAGGQESDVCYPVKVPEKGLDKVISM